MTLKLVLFSLLSASATAHMVTKEGEFLTNVDAVAATNLPAQNASITLTAQQPNFNAFNLSTLLPSVPYTTTTLATVPQNCQSYTTSTTSSPPECPAGNTLTATSVTFADCGSQFTICRCDNSTTMSLDDALSKFAQVPVGLRRYVATVMLLPDSEPHAYTLASGDIHMFATTELDTWIHESTHALDYATPGTPLSATPNWLSTQNTDSCVPDTYSQTNAIEDFAQMGVLKIYALANNGQLPPQFDNQCMKNQLAFMDSLPQYNATTMFGNTCDFQATEQVGGTVTGLGVKHILPPVTLDTHIVSPFRSSNTTAASGFRKLPAPTGNFGAQPSVVAVESNPSKQQSSAHSLALSFGTVMVGALVSVAALI